MKLLILGCGSIGERHLRNLLSFFNGEIAVCDQRAFRLAVIERKYKVLTFADYQKALRTFAPTAVLVCTPTNYHVAQALAAVRNGCDVFVEKPIASSVKGVAGLLKLARKREKLVYVGFSMRFNPNLIMAQKMIEQGKLGKLYSARAYFGSYLPDRHPGQDYRADYGGKRKMGGGVLLDAGSHLLDYLFWLFGRPQQLVSAANKLSDLEIDVEDNAELLAKYSGGLTVSLHVDFLRRPWQHFLEIVAAKGTLVWSFSQAGNKLKWYDGKRGKWEILIGQVDLNSVYLAEMKDFVKCLRHRAKPGVDGQAAAEYLRILLKAIGPSKKLRILDLQGV